MPKSSGERNEQEIQPFLVSRNGARAWRRLQQCACAEGFSAQVIAECLRRISAVRAHRRLHLHIKMTTE